MTLFFDLNKYFSPFNAVFFVVLLFCRFRCVGRTWRCFCPFWKMAWSTCPRVLGDTTRGFCSEELAPVTHMFFRRLDAAIFLSRGFFLSLRLPLAA